MKPPYLPGLPTVAALMLAAILTAWLGLFGPINLEQLKAWQPLMAALIALGAGTLAYYGAMAKVDLDRAVHKEQQLRRRTTLLLKLSNAARIFQSEIIIIREKTGAKVYEPAMEITKRDFALRWPPEFQEAWDNLDLFDAVIATLLAYIKYRCSQLEAAVADLDPTSRWEYKWPSEPPPAIRRAVKIVKDLEGIANDLVRLTPPEEGEWARAEARYAKRL